MKSWPLLLFPSAGLVLALAAEGTTALPPPARTGRETRRLALPGGLWHRVLPGEDLRGLARRYYRDPRYGRVLAEANRLPGTPAPGRLLWVPVVDIAPSVVTPAGGPAHPR